MTTQALLASALSRGFSVRDLEDITIGMIIDILSEFIPEKDQERDAKQADIDRL